jgi:hypothetical protein
MATINFSLSTSIAVAAVDSPREPTILSKISLSVTLYVLLILLIAHFRFAQKSGWKWKKKKGIFPVQKFL